MRLCRRRATPGSATSITLRANQRLQQPSLVLQGDKQLREAMDVILECAFGSIPYTDSTCVPSSATCVDVALRESAYNPLHPQHQLQQQDETLYVAFQQHIQIKVSLQLQRARHSAARPCPAGLQLCFLAMLEAQQGKGLYVALQQQHMQAQSQVEASPAAHMQTRLYRVGICPPPCTHNCQGPRNASSSSTSCPCVHGAEAVASGRGSDGNLHCSAGEDQC